MMQVDIQYGRGSIPLECKPHRTKSYDPQIYRIDNVLAIAGAVWDLLDANNDNDKSCNEGNYYLHSSPPQDVNKDGQVPINELLALIMMYDIQSVADSWGYNFFRYILRSYSGTQVSTTV
jgi:hypothetical protein